MVKLSMVILALTFIGNNTRLSVANSSTHVPTAEITHTTPDCLNFKHGSIVIVSGFQGDIEVESRLDENLTLQVQGKLDARSAVLYSMRKGTKVIMPKKDFGQVVQLNFYDKNLNVLICSTQIILD